MAVGKLRIGNVTVRFLMSSKWRAGSKQRRADLQKYIDKLDAHIFHSVSHTDHTGGFAFADKPIGFDLEKRDREISDRAILRLGSRQELKLVDGRALAIWVMKEAAFKALRRNGQPKTITAITIATAKRRRLNKSDGSSNLLWRFSFKSSNSNGLHRSGRGSCFYSRRTIVGIALADT